MVGIFDGKIFTHDNFFSNIPHTPEELGLKFGKNLSLIVNRESYIYINNPVQDLGECYIIIDNDTTVRLIPKTRSTLALSQVVRYIDYTFNYNTLNSEEMDSWPNFYKSFTVNNQTFTELTVEAVELIKYTEVIYLEIDSENIDVGLLMQLQARFGSVAEANTRVQAMLDAAKPKGIIWAIIGSPDGIYPLVDWEYQDKCVVLRRKLDI